MLTKVHYFTRRASHERRLAREALTEAARDRHASLADHFATLADHARQSPVGLGSMAVGQE